MKIELDLPTVPNSDQLRSFIVSLMVAKSFAKNSAYDFEDFEAISNIQHLIDSLQDSLASIEFDSLIDPSTDQLPLIDVSESSSTPLSQIIQST